MVTKFIYITIAILVLLVTTFGLGMLLENPNAAIFFLVEIVCFSVITCTGIIVSRIEKLIKALNDPRNRISKDDSQKN